jgi:hypothetical protein
MDSFPSVLHACSNRSTIRQTSRHLHKLILLKQIWLPIVTALQTRSFIHLPPDQFLADLLAEELVELTRHATRGPRCWLQPAGRGQFIDESLERIWSGLPDKLTTLFRPQDLGTHEGLELTPKKPGLIRRVILSRQNTTPNHGSSKEYDIQVLPGGQYLLFREQSTLECWLLAQRKVVWRYSKSMTNDAQNNIRRTDFAFEMIEEGRALVMLLLTLDRTAGKYVFLHQFL